MEFSELPRTFVFLASIGCLVTTAFVDEASAQQAGSSTVASFEGNRWYWQIDGEPTMLLGANQTDHTFLMENPKAYLQELQHVGGNLVRNTMSQREPEPAHRPHLYLKNGKYDLTQWNPVYWEKLEGLLAECQRRKIVVALEMWDKFDYQRDYWAESAWRPANNVNYTLQESGLRDVYGPTKRSNEKNELHHDNPFLRTLPTLDNNPLILEYQQTFFEKTLSVTLQFPNVIYFVGNEWKEAPEWPEYWAGQIHKLAAGKTVPVSVMVWSSSKAFDPEIEFVLKHDELFQFAGFRVGNPKIPLGQGHYDRIMEVRSRVAQSGARPLVDSKIRTGNKTFFRPVRQARVWRGMMAGWSALSHHRVHDHPTRGPSLDMGFTAAAQANLRALRRFSDAVKPWDCVPAPNLLSDRSNDEAYVLADAGQAYGVYFVLGGTVGLDVAGEDAEYELTWLNIQTGESKVADARVMGGEIVEITTPASGSQFGWAATLVRQK
jgi:hypothetical protein